MTVPIDEGTLKAIEAVINASRSSPPPADFAGYVTQVRKFITRVENLSDFSDLAVEGKVVDGRLVRPRLHPTQILLAKALLNMAGLTFIYVEKAISQGWYEDSEIADARQIVAP